MADKDDHLTYYRQFFENFAKTLNPNDQLPVKLASYKLVNTEIVGGIIDWTTQYLSQKKCPPNLCAPLIKIVIDEIRKACKKHPVNCGFNPADNAYEPLKLMQTVMAKTNEVCLRYLDNSMLCSLPSPESGNQYYLTSVYAIKNTRRRMEDRHVVIHDLNTMFNIQEDIPSSYYAIFDGHAGHDAAAYSSAHLHQFLAESDSFLTDPKQALSDAFCQTDALFINKCEVEHLSSGTTAVVALVRPKEKMLYIAWAGDSQATLVGRDRVVQLVNPHKPCRNDERERIEQQGGCVIKWGTWRVNGQLAVSRAIGDPDYKPFVIAVPDIQEIPLEGNDFLVLACDGLWDSLSEEAVAHMVYSCISKNPDDTDSISKFLVLKAKQQGSSDNISVIVVFLREPSKIAAEAHWANRNLYTMEEGLNNANNPNPFGCANGSPAAKTEGGLHKQNGLAQEQMFEKSNGKRLASEFDEQDDDFGPETDVDAVDDVIPVTTGTKCEVPKSFAECFDPISNYSGFEEEGVCNPFVEHQEKASAEMQKVKKKVEFQEDEEREAREETPTPPADAVHDASGLVDSESEDEWNYFKGGEADKENVSPQLEKEVADIAEEDDTMSQLNPNAAEFVPVSPTRNVASPPSCIRGLNEAIISESPKKAIDIDISLPNVRDFEKEVKSRPGDINLSDGSISKSSTSDSSSSNVYRSFEDLPTICSSRDNPSKDLMENILNGKNIDEIPEFQPNSDSPKKVFQTDEFHFGPKALPFINKPNEQDDSSTADSCASVDPATASPDLNKLHDIPDDLEKFLESDNDISNDTSDRGAPREPNKDNDAFKLSSNFDNEKELASPLESERDASKSDEPKLLPNIDFLNVSSEDRPNDVARDLLNSVESESICCSNESNTVESSRDSYDVLSKSPAPLESDYTRPEALELARQSFEELCSAEPPLRDLQRETSMDATPAELIREADARFEDLCKPLESPLEEVTSSVKDDLSEGTGDNDNGDVRLIDTDDHLVDDVAPEAEPIIAENEPTKVENLVELPKEEVNVMVPSIEHDEDESLLKSCDIKTEPILEPTVVAPEAPKIDDTPAFLDSQTTNTNDAQKLLSELESEMTAIGITSTVAAGAAFTAVLTEKERPAPAADVPQEAEKEPLEEHQDNQQKEPEPKEEEAPKTKPVTSKTAAAAAPKASKTAVKAPLPKTAASATNRLASKTSVASKASGTVKAASKSTLAAKPTARSAPVKTADKVLNGEAKPSARLTSARRPVETASKPKLPAQTATSKPNVTKAPTKKLEPTAVKTTKSVEMKQRTVAKKPLDKPNTAVSAATKVSNATKAPSSGVATKPKPSTLTAPPKPRVPLTKTVAKTDAPKADAQKQNKENVNKLMASRTATKPASSNAKKVETKVSSVRTVTKTSTTTTTLANKKKTITSPKPEKIEKPKENGVAAIVTEVN